MTSPKSVSWSALVNVGNNESIALTVSGEAANPDEARDMFAFACGQLLGIANSADEATAPLIRAYVSRLVQTEEAAKQDAMPATPPSATDQAAAAAARCVKPQPPAKTSPPTAAEQAAAAVAQIVKPPAAPPKSETSDPYDIVICERCGAETTKAQAKLSQLFMSKTLCKQCMEAP